jgi:hypothetical protein
MTDLPGQAGPPADPSALRAADSDRDRVAEVLRQAAGEGRLTPDELDERLGQAYAARTFAQLEPITRDLPHHDQPARIVPAAGNRADVAPTSRFALAIMGGFRRSGYWVAPRDFTALALMGGGEIDLREAQFAEGQVTIRALALMGGITIVVPAGADVRVHAIGIMGGVEEPGTTPVRPGAPKIVVVGLALMGGIEVKYKPPREEPWRGSKQLPAP